MFRENCRKYILPIQVISRIHCSLVDKTSEYKPIYLVLRKLSGRASVPLWQDN